MNNIPNIQDNTKEVLPQFDTSNITNSEHLQRSECGYTTLTYSVGPPNELNVGQHTQITDTTFSLRKIFLYNFH